MWAEKIAAYSLPSCSATRSRLRSISAVGGGDGPVQPLELVFDRVARQEPPRDAESLVVHDEHFADRHAGRNGNPLQTFHVLTCRMPTQSPRAAAARLPACIASILKQIGRTAGGFEQPAYVMRHADRQISASI